MLVIVNSEKEVFINKKWLIKKIKKFMDDKKELLNKLLETYLLI